MTQIIETFRPPNYQQLLRTKLYNLQQKKDIYTYVREFRTLMGQIENMTDEDKKLHFIRRLKPATRVDVSCREPADLETAIKQASNYEIARFGQEIATVHKPVYNDHHSHHHRNQADTNGP